MNALYGGYGDDTLVGGYDEKSDDMYGAYGANKYIIKANSASNNARVANINSISGQDTIEFTNISAENLYFKLDGNDLNIYTNGNPDANYVTIEDWKKLPHDFLIKTLGADEPQSLFDMMAANSHDHYVGTDVNFVRGSSKSDPSKLIVIGSSVIDTVSNHDLGKSRLITTAEGNDSINSNGFNDTIFSGNGDDYIYHDSGTGNEGTVRIDTGAGNDTIRAYGDSTAFVVGGAGADKITTNDGNDIIYTCSRAYAEMAGSPGDPDVDIYNKEASISSLSGTYISPDFGGFGDYADTVTSGAGNDTIIALGENTDLQGQDGNDHYHVSLDNNTKITDASGINKLYIHTLEDVSVDGAVFAMNVDRTGNVDDIVIMRYDQLDNWAENPGSFSGDHGGIRLMSGTNTVSEIYHGYEGSQVMRSADLVELKEEVVDWLNSANNGAGYADVATALASNEAGELKAIFNDFADNGHWHDITP